MRLSSLRLCNFRQFKGESPEIAFASPGEKPVTVIFGTNGAGKTALLNAFTWTLYGTTSRGFLLPDQVVNKAAIRESKAGDTIEAWVEIKFDHLEHKYVIRRSHRVRRGNTEADVVALGEPVTELQWAGADGRWRPETSIVDAVGRILPEDLHTYFFFDGERIERLVQPDEKERADVANATKKLFSLEILDRAIRHVDSARKTLESEYKKIGDAEAVKLIEEKSSIEKSMAETRERHKELARNIEGHRKLEEEIQGRLRNLQAVREIQERRDGLNRDLEARSSSLQQVREQVSSLISSRGYTVFIAEACATYRSVEEGMRQRNELPAGIKKQFVKDLLDRNLCICSRGLGPDEYREARAAVEDWKNRAGLDAVEEKVIRMGGEVKQLEVYTGEFWTQLDHLEERRAADTREVSRIQDALDQISDEFMKSGREEVGQLETRLVSTKTAIENDLREQGSCGEQTKRLQERLNAVEASIERHQATEVKQQIAKRRLSAAKDVIERITESKRRFEEKFRIDLTKKLRALFDTVSYTPYVPEVTEEYSLRLRESAGGIPLPVAASQGESQILSLCFIGAVIDLARDYQKRQERLPGPDSSQFPVVMDSPFGSLGPTYRRQVADHVTRLADQIVLMVTNTQWRGEVEQSLRSRVGRAYVLQYYSPKPDISSETVDVGGRSFDLIKKSPNEFEYTMLTEVSNA
jgi:DNA sulfur modification protein DndD